MIIAITSTGAARSSEIDRRFGRAHGFLLVDTESGEDKYLSNEQNLQAVQGAGVQAAQTVVEAGAEVVITGNCGPKAFLALSAAKVRVFTVESVTIAEALELYDSDSLEEAATANVDGHW